MATIKGETIILTITNRCNLKCSYCYERLKNKSDMSQQKAIDIISNVLENSLYPAVEIDFHGGEPLLNFPLIKNTCEYFWQQKQKRPYMFFASTNGSCLTEEMKNWFILHKDRICLGLSLDGTPQMNYTNRGYYIPDDVLDFFVTTWPHQSVKMTISPNTISNIGNGIIFAHKKGFEVSVNLAYGINWDKKLVPIYEQELMKVLQFYLDNPNIKPCSIFDKTVKEIFYRTPLKRFCGAGKQLKAFDVDGNMYPCHVFGPNTLNISDWEMIKKLDLSHDEELFIDKECTGCPIQRICPTCHGMNYLERGDVGKRDKRLCPFIKTEKKLLCLYLKETILQKDINELNETDYLELSAVKKLLSDL